MSNYSLRPEDFRFAWANAYQAAILDVRDLQRQSDKQLAALKDLADLSSNQSEFGRINLYRTATVIVEQLKQASADSQNRIDAATHRLVDHANWLLEREKKLQAASEKLTRELALERRKLQDELAKLQERSISRRLLRLLRPRRTVDA